LKGIQLLDTVYREDPESRALGDLDLLVPRERVDEAVARLGSLGLEESALSHRIREVSPERFLTDGRLPVELHTRLGVKHGARSAWEDLRPRPGRVHGREVFTLDRETTLVHLVAHLVKHRPFSRLGWVEDVLRWIRRGLDAEGALARASELGALRSFVAGVGILRRALGPLGLPAVHGQALRPSGRLAVRFHDRLVWDDLLRDPWSAGPGSPFGRTLSVLLLVDRPGDVGGFLRAKLAERRQRR
ncbi:MAG: nucleotidyltransferase family protein, partial [Acidobacteriota bacterium]